MHKKTVIDFKTLGKRYIFTKPIKELKTRKISQVKDILEAVNEAQTQGYYVVGYVSYEAAPAFEERFQVHTAPLQGEYLAYFTVHEQAEETTIPLSYKPVDMPEKWQTLTSQQEYQKAIETIHHHIRQGDTYQVNYTIQLQQKLTADSWAVYNRLVVEQNAAYNAYIEHDDLAILSISPELFFEKNGAELTTRPMKGTTKRGLTEADDLQQAAWLAQDSKNRAENMMIVDLLRNDMNRISEIGSEQVQQLCQVEQYSTVWQMTSTIKSQIKQGLNLVDVFQALFPCGSITGAPKISTMEIIHQVEKQARGVYCGTVGICLPENRAIFNVAIRTIQKKGDQAIYGVGGGITWDSTWQGEYLETQQKSAVLYRKNPQFDIITTGKISQGQLTFLPQHLERLRQAARYFAYPFDQEKVAQAIQECCQELPDQQDYRLRIAISKSGQIKLETAILTDLSSDFLQATVVQQDAALDTAFSYFKTSHRPHITMADQEQIFYNAQGQLLETSIGNLILEIDGQHWTPPVELGILNGIYRQHLIQKQQVQEKILSLDDLAQTQTVYACNALRGLYELKLDL